MEPWFDYRHGLEIFPLIKEFRRVVGPHVGVAYLGVKRPGRVAVHLSPLVLRLGMSGAVLSLTLYALMVCTGTILPF